MKVVERSGDTDTALSCSGLNIADRGPFMTILIGEASQKNNLIGPEVPVFEATVNIGIGYQSRIQKVALALTGCLPCYSCRRLQFFGQIEQ